MFRFKKTLWSALLGLVMWASPSWAACPIVTRAGQQYLTCDTTFSGDITFLGSVSIPGGVADPSSVKQTTEAKTYYVRALGNDLFDCETALTACATIQGALDKVPMVIGHVTQVDIGAGSFDTFTVGSFHITGGGYLKVYGVISLSTTVTAPGTASGTAENPASERVLTDTDQSWVVNDLAGKYLKVGGQFWLIQSNTATSLTITGSNASVTFGTGTSYAIWDPKTTTGAILVAGPSGSGPVLSYGIELSNLDASSVTAYDATAFLSFSRIRTPATGWWSFLISGALGVTLDGVYLKDAGSIALGAWNVGNLTLNGVMADGALSVVSPSIYIMNVGLLSDAYVVANNGAHSGIGFWSTTGAASELSASGNAKHGVYIAGGSKIGMLSPSEASSVRFLLGTGNTEYGVYVDSYSELLFDDTPTITGTKGNLTLDRGATTLTWATHFNDDGDMAVNPNLFCRVERKDLP